MRGRERLKFTVYRQTQTSAVYRPINVIQSSSMKSHQANVSPRPEVHAGVNSSRHQLLEHPCPLDAKKCWKNNQIEADMEMSVTVRSFSLLERRPMVLCPSHVVFGPSNLKGIRYSVAPSSCMLQNVGNTTGLDNIWTITGRSRCALPSAVCAPTFPNAEPLISNESSSVLQSQQSKFLGAVRHVTNVASLRGR